MNIDNFYLSKKDKNNINLWLEKFNKPLFITGNIGIGKTELVNTILKDYTQVIIDHNLLSNISDFINKTINEKHITNPKRRTTLPGQHWRKHLQCFV